MNDFYDKLKCLFLYGGVSREDFMSVRNKIRNENRSIARMFSRLAFILISIMFFVSLRRSEFSSSTVIYATGMITSAIIYALAKFGKKLISVYIATYLAEFYFLLYGFTIGLFSRSDQQTTTFIVMLILLPLIFIDRPIITSGITIVFVVIFSICAYYLKADDVRYVDILDAFVFGALSIASGTIIIRVRIHEFVLQSKFQALSELDQLTGLRNRNCYEQKLLKYEYAYDDNIHCVYFDVNGLHELNNEKGHKEGDRMLQYVAAQIQSVFGIDNTYRVGGDEYIAFMLDTSVSNVKCLIDSIVNHIEREGYHVAVGHCVQTKTDRDINILVKTAEKYMYDNKKQYYIRHDRRAR